MAKKGGGGGADPRYEMHTVYDPATGRSFSSSPALQAIGAPTAENQLADFQAQQKSAADVKAASDKAAADAQSAADEQTFQTRKQSAYDAALADTRRAFTNAGVNPDDYMTNYIQPQLQHRANTMADKDPNPYGSYPTTLGADIVNQALSDRRGQLTNQLNTVFTPTYAMTALPDTTSAASESQILGERFDPLVTQLQNAQKRGQLTDIGYNAALDALNQKKSAAQSTIHSLAQNILGTDRASINDLISGARSDIAGSSLSQAFDPSQYFTSAASRAGDYASGFGGALRNAVGNTEFASLADLMNAGGAVQGPTNPVANVGAQAAGFPLTDEQANRKRGLGSTGAF